MVWRRILLGVLVGLNLFLLYQIVWSSNGLFAYLELKQRHEELVKVIQETTDKSLGLSRTIRWLQSDPDYQERVIRSQMGFLRQDEIVYIFPEDGNNTEPDPGGERGDDGKD